MKNTGIILIFILLIGYYSFSQNTLKLSLEQCISIAKTKSPAAKMAVSSYKQKQLNYESFRAGFYPQLSFNGEAPGLSRSIQQIYQPNGSLLYLPLSYYTSFGELSLSQKIPLSGGSISLSSRLSNYTTKYDKTYNYWLGSPLLIAFQQPIFQFNSMAWDREEQEIRDMQNDKSFLETMEDISMEATQKFFDAYISGMNVRNAELNVAINDSLYVLSKGRYEVGKIAENDLLQSELALSNVKIELESTSLEHKRALEDLIITLGLENVNEIEIIPPAKIPDFDINLGIALEQAKKNRSDILTYKIQEIGAERQVSSAKFSNGFNASLYASFGMNQTASKVPDAYKDLLDQEYFNINFQIPIFQWGKGSAAVESAVMERERVKSSIDLQKQNFELNVKYQILSFRQLQKQVQISAKSDTIAQRRFEVAKNRYLIGKIDMNTLFIAQNEKDAALRSYIQTLKSFWTGYYRLRRLTLYDFEKGEPIIK